MFFPKNADTRFDVVDRNKKHHEFFTVGKAAAKYWWCRLLSSVHWAVSSSVSC